VARLAVLASGNGSNFQALAEALRADGGHEAALLVCDRPGAFALERAARLGIPARLIRYAGRPREDAEAEIAAALEDADVDLVALAGFMRLLGPSLVERWEGRMVNVHPALLPAYPGTRSIERAWEAGDAELGVTVHFVDRGMDTGRIIGQARVPRGETLEATEEAVHRAEHALYPRIVLDLLDGIPGAEAPRRT